MIYVFKCENEHTVEKIRIKPYKRRVRYRCSKCGLWMYRDIQSEHGKEKKTIHLDYKNDPISHLAKKRSFKGIMVEHLTPEPVFVENKAQYDKLLKDTNSRESTKR